MNVVRHDYLSQIKVKYNMLISLNFPKWICVASFIESLKQSLLERKPVVNKSSNFDAVNEY